MTESEWQTRKQRIETRGRSLSPPWQITGYRETLEKRRWSAAEQAGPALRFGLKSQECSGSRPQEPALGLIFRRVAEVRFAVRRARLEKAAHRMMIGILLLASTVLPAVAASGLFADERTACGRFGSRRAGMHWTL